MKAFANRPRKDITFAPNDLVLLNCKRLTFPGRDADKLQPRFIGSFRVLF